MIISELLNRVSQVLCDLISTYCSCLNSQLSLLGFHAAAILIYVTDVSMCHILSSPAELCPSCPLCRLGSLSSPSTIYA